MKAKSIVRVFFGAAVIIFTLSNGASAQDVSESSSGSIMDRFAVAVNVSTIGFGGEVAGEINSHFSLRLRYNAMKLNLDERDIDLDDQSVLLSGDYTTSEIDFGVEYHPFATKGFKIVGGVASFMKAEATALAVYNGDSQSFGEITVDREDVGDMNFLIDYSGVAPFLALGVGRAVPKKRVGFGFEIGTFYTQAPKVDITATQMLKPTEGEAQELQDNLSDFRWYPYLSIRLAVKL